MVVILSLKPIFFFIIFTAVIADDPSLNDNPNWNGNWFPHAPGAKDLNQASEIRKDLYDREHGVKMGIKSHQCDDGKSNLEVDWDYNPVNHTCFDLNKANFYPREDIQPIFSKEHIPKGYHSIHKCMSSPIDYSSTIPTFGPHRPLWAQFGEYAFLPKQRWIHNLEHGAIVMLYHPCADKNEVYMLKKLVTNCLYRHIITPYNLLSSERPLALVAWGRRLEMSKVAPEVVIDFIKKHALHGPERLWFDGQFKELLIKHADIVTDIKDSELCKLYNFIE